MEKKFIENIYRITNKYSIKLIKMLKTEKIEEIGGLSIIIMTDVNFLKLIIYLSIYFDERQKEINHLYISC